ncbi:MAG: Holliday junction resolvase RuvX [Ignavibacteriales bacterium]|nr:Holliday junction resolvase RuvX [Ignavibacteriales bacterium]
MTVDHTAGQHKRIMGIDFGTTRIGLSLSDPLQIIAVPFKTLDNKLGVIDRICETIQQEEVGLVVVGMPLNLKGEKGKKAVEVEKFVEEVRKGTSIEIIHWDERFTTSIAHQTLLTMGTKREDRRTNKGRVDAMAAAILLQGFLDSRKRSLIC